MRRWLHLPLGTYLICWLLGSLGFAAQGPDPGRPNILLAIADDWSWPHAGAYGEKAVRTPSFDRIASEGVLFDQAFVSSPSCTPSRAALLTGQYHWRLRESANLWSTLASDIPTYPDLLEQAGYFVGYTRKGWGPGRIEPGGRARNPAGEQFADFASFIRSRPQGRPFCFWFGSVDPHRDYEEGSGEAGGIDPKRIRIPGHLPDESVVRSDIADYLWEVQRFDQELGGILRLIEEMGELENTLVVVTSDNGMPFPRCKGTVYDCGVRVPMALRWGERVEAGLVSPELVSLTDLAPTFLEAAGLETPRQMTGRSLISWLSGGSRDSRELRQAVFFGKERHVPCQEAPDSGGTPMRAIRTARFLYIRNFRPERWPAGTPNYEKAFFPGSWFGDVDNGPTKSFMVGEQNRDENLRRLFELAFGKRPAEELYDMQSDPGQLLNLAEDPLYAEIRSELAGRLEKLLRETEDPRLGPDPDQFDRYPYYGGSPLKPGFEADKP